MAKHPSKIEDRDFLAFRVGRTVADEVRLIARREAETQASVLRRLVRRGLQVERQEERQ